MKKILSLLLLVLTFAVGAAETKVPVYWERKRAPEEFTIGKFGAAVTADKVIFAIEIKNFAQAVKDNANLVIYWNSDLNRATGRFANSQGVDWQLNCDFARNTLKLIKWQDDKKRTNADINGNWDISVDEDVVFLSIGKAAFGEISMPEKFEARVALSGKSGKKDSVWVNHAPGKTFLTLPAKDLQTQNTGKNTGNLQVPIMWQRNGSGKDYQVMQAGAYQDKDKYIFAFKINKLQEMLKSKTSCSLYWNCDNDKTTGRFPNSTGIDVQFNVDVTGGKLVIVRWHDAKSHRSMTIYEDDYLVQTVGDVLYIGLRKPALAQLNIKDPSTYFVSVSGFGKQSDRVYSKVDAAAKGKGFIAPALDFRGFGALQSTRVKKSYAYPVNRPGASAAVWDCGGERFKPDEPTPKFSKTIPGLKLKGAKGETLSFFFAVEMGKNFSSLQIVPGVLTGAGKKTIAVDAQMIQYADYIADDRDEKYIDILKPAFPGKAVKRQFAVWHVTVPRDAAAGTYRGELALTIDGKADKAIPVEVAVYDFAIPEVPAMRSAMSIKRSHISSNFKNSRIDVDIEAVYNEMIDRCQRFRIGPRLPRVEPKFSLDKDGKLHIFWDDFDARAKYLFNEKKINALQLPPAQLGSHGKFYRWNALLKKNFSGTADPAFQDVWKQYIRQYVDHMKTLDFADKMLFIIWDEPYGLEEPLQAAKIVREVAPELPIGIFIDRCDPVLRDYIDIWMVTLQTIKQTLELAKGKRVWLYNSNGMNNFRIPAADIRSFFYLADRNGIEGFLSSEINEINKSGEKDGVFFNHYPQHCLFYVSSDGKVVYDSWRLVLLRQGFNDYDYLAIYKKLLKSKNLSVPQWLIDAEPVFEADGLPDFKIDTTAELDVLKDRIAREIEKLSK